MGFNSLRRCHAQYQWSGYLFACALVAAAQAGQYLFKNYWQSGHTHVLLYYLSLTIAAWYGGGKAGLLATMLGTLAYVYHSFGSSGHVDIALTLLFIATGIITSLLFESVARAEVALRLADRRKDEFLATLAHELGNPLAPISNAMEILRTTKDDATRQKLTGIIERRIRQMTQLVDDLMDVERIAQDKIALRKRPVRLMAAINSAADSVKPLITEKKHVLLVSVPPQPVWLDGDMTRLTQILANVLNKAAKYTEPGGTIRIDATMDGDLARIDISDTGIGIAPDMMPRVFDMFAQTDGTSGNRKSGIGIGLALVRKLVELHGGSIRAHSAGLARAANSRYSCRQRPKVLRPHRNANPHFVQIRTIAAYWWWMTASIRPRRCPGCWSGRDSRSKWRMMDPPPSRWQSPSSPK